MLNIIHVQYICADYNLLFDIIYRYGSYLSSTNHSRNKLELPAITLCHMSSLRQSVATQLFTEQYLHSNFGREAVYAQFENPLLFLPYWRYLEETQMQKVCGF